MICSAIGFALLVTSPATCLAGMILISISHSEVLAYLVFISIVAATLFGFFCQPKRRPARGEVQHISVHAFVSYVRMHPELLYGKNEFDLERFRKQWDGRGQMSLAAWSGQFSGNTPAAHPSGQFR